MRSWRLSWRLSWSTSKVALAYWSSLSICQSITQRQHLVPLSLAPAESGAPTHLKSLKYLKYEIGDLKMRSSLRNDPVSGMSHNTTTLADQTKPQKERRRSDPGTIMTSERPTSPETYKFVPGWSVPPREYGPKLSKELFSRYGKTLVWRPEAKRYEQFSLREIMSPEWVAEQETPTGKPAWYKSVFPHRCASVTRPS